MSRKLLVVQMKLFVSWSGPKAFIGGKQISESIQMILPSVEIFFSPNDIQKGENWPERLYQELENCDAGVFCCTSENATSQWMMFEAGALAIHKAKTRLFAIALDDEPIAPPLGHFQRTSIKGDSSHIKKEFRSLIESINQSAPDGYRLKQELLNKNFGSVWPAIWKKLGKILAAEAESKALSSAIIPIETAPILSEMVELVRSIHNRVQFPRTPSPNFENRVMLEHNFIHHARNFCVQMLPFIERTSYAECLKRFAKDLPHPALIYWKPEIQRLLEEMLYVFESVVEPPGKLWISLRDRRGDEHYHTFTRAGRYSPGRDATSKSLNKDTSPTITQLKRSFAGGRCVIITGSKEGRDKWERQPNDEKYKEDRSVLMGTVMEKSWDRTKVKNHRLCWVISICSDKEDLFSPGHVPLMQCCVDVFSNVLNVMSRQLVPRPSEVASN